MITQLPPVPLPQSRRTLLEQAQHFRAVAIRFEKHDANYLAAIKQASARIWMRLPRAGFCLSKAGPIAALPCFRGLRSRFIEQYLQLLDSKRAGFWCTDRPLKLGNRDFGAGIGVSSDGGDIKA